MTSLTTHHSDGVYEIGTLLRQHRRMLASRRSARVHSRFRGPETPSICFLTVAECPSYTAVHRRRSVLPCCCCPYFEQPAPTCPHPVCLFSEVASRLSCRHSFPWLLPQCGCHFRTLKSFFFLLSLSLPVKCAHATDRQTDVAEWLACSRIGCSVIIMLIVLLVHLVGLVFGDIAYMYVFHCQYQWFAWLQPYETHLVEKWHQIKCRQWLFNDADTETFGGDTGIKVLDNKIDRQA